jgi:ubiquinone/menaquinone biosynthesis C-methylase UbiE
MEGTMSDPSDARRELPSTYVVQDRGNTEEIIRLEIQDKMMTFMMGGVLPELADPTLLRRVLDVGCGTGGWLMETARIYPSIEKLVGVDISSSMRAFADAQAKAMHLDGRVEFRTMDALRALEFPPASFDLVNQRAGMSWLRTWDWTKVLLEYQRVTRQDGIIRITEPSTIMESSSPALMMLNNIIIETYHRSGRFLTPSSDGVTGELVRLMTQHGIGDVKSRVHTTVYRAGTVECQYLYEDMLHLFRVALPFFRKWTRVPSNYDEIYQQALKEMQEPDFVAKGLLLTAWGTRDGKFLRMRHRG